MESLTFCGEKLFDTNHKMDGAHKLIHEELLRISNKCDSIKIKCEQAGAAASSPQIEYTLVSLLKVPPLAHDVEETRKNTPPIVTGTSDLISKPNLSQVLSSTFG